MMPAPAPIPAAPPSEAEQLRAALRHTVYCTGAWTCDGCADALRLLGEDPGDTCALCQRAPRVGPGIVCVSCAQETRHG